ncbi:YmfQ family protein [Neisseriaceae bacterium ESL0693]|nr:YmfQ family protein [Neisseriaceae bacterium ESL0693]
MNYKNTLLGLLPPVSYNRTGSGIRQDAEISGHALDAIQESATRCLNVIDPRTAGNYLLDWERVYGLDGSGKNTQQRVQTVLAKLNETGGLSIPYFINLAATLGYVITITEPQPFRAGISRCGDRLATEDIMWVWWVNVQNAVSNANYFRTGIAGTGDRLSDYGNDVIESVFHDLKPAFTAIRFTYQKVKNVSD